MVKLQTWDKEGTNPVTHRAGNPEDSRAVLHPQGEILPPGYPPDYPGRGEACSEPHLGSVSCGRGGEQGRSPHRHSWEAAGLAWRKARRSLNGDEGKSQTTGRRPKQQPASLRQDGLQTDATGKGTLPEAASQATL